MDGNFNTTNAYTEKGLVKKVENNTAFIQLIPSDSCHKCPAKKFCHKDETTGLWAYTNNLDIKEGMKVEIVLNTGITLWRIFMFTLLPLIIFLAGYFIGTYFKQPYIWGITLFVLYYIILYLYSKRVKKDVIAKIINIIN